MPLSQEEIEYAAAYQAYISTDYAQSNTLLTAFIQNYQIAQLFQMLSTILHVHITNWDFMTPH